jgi:hypothetical protein
VRETFSKASYVFSIYTAGEIIGITCVLAGIINRKYLDSDLRLLA